MNKLEGKIAVVAGATRGAGRGIATALGEAGATVHCTGRSVRGATTGRPETIEETAELVTARGGRGIATRVDHRDPEQVAAFFAKLDRVDILVNDIWGGDDIVQWGQKFWEVDLPSHLGLLDTAIKSHIITSHYAAPLIPKGGLIVEITDGDDHQYRGHLYYDLVKASVIRLALAQSRDLKRRGVNVVAVSPGFLRSEWMLDHLGVTEENWRDAVKQDPAFIASETPLYVGRAIAALASDPDVGKKNGKVFASWTLSEQYDFTDADGSRPHFKRWLEASTHPRPDAT